MKIALKAKVRARITFKEETVYEPGQGIYKRLEPQVRIYEPQLMDDYQKRIIKGIKNDPEIKKAIRNANRRAKR